MRVRLPSAISSAEMLVSWMPRALTARRKRVRFSIAWMRETTLGLCLCSTPVIRVRSTIGATPVERSVSRSAI